MDALQNAAKELGEAYDDYFALSDLLRLDGNRILDDLVTDQTWRRNLVRVTWPMIEAYASTLRRFCNIFKKYCELNLNTKQKRLLEDESLFGSAERIKETLKLAYKLHDLEITPNFGDTNWECVCKAIKVRDRITHPESAGDLVITDEDWPDIHIGLSWVLSRFTVFFDEVLKKHGPTV